jgi:hypothetical protein
MQNSPKTRKQADSKAMSIPAPVEDSWGFYGTLLSEDEISKEIAKQVWDVACQEVAAVFEETNPAVVRNFLRAPAGRHLADSVSDHATGQTAVEYAESVRIAIRETNAKGRNIWKRSFEEVKKATESGAWLD